MEEIMKTVELKQGLNGSGYPVYVVFVKKGEKVLGMDSFESKEEAENWIKWACQDSKRID